jgi:rubrerythrin
MLNDANARRKLAFLPSGKAIMTSLKREPAGRVRTLDEFFALAHAIESDAAARYIEVARQLKQQGAAHLAEVFERLAEVERGHVMEITNRAAQRGESAPPDARPPWPIPDTFDASPDEIVQSKLLTPYRALASAVRREERSFAFWTYVAAHAEKTEVREAAESMALDELENVSLLRRERRQAFHAQRGLSGSIKANAAALAALERRVCELLEEDPTAFPEDSEFAKMIIHASREAASELEALHATHHPTLSVPRLPATLNDDPLAISELLVEAYLTLADSSKNAHVVDVAQHLGGAAIYRLAMLRSGSDSGIEKPQAGSGKLNWQAP